LNPFWGSYVDTTAVSTGTAEIKIRFYKTSSLSEDQGVNITVDNIWPQVQINGLKHFQNNVYQNVGACAIVQGTSTLFNFNITARDPDQHLLSYALSAVWGDNKGKGVTSVSFTPPVPPAVPLWAGITNTIVPATPGHWNALVVGDPTSISCAHTFYLGAWDRAINGWGYIHYSSYTYSVTFLLT